jgi:hypothetical protein
MHDLQLWRPWIINSHYAYIILVTTVFGKSMVKNACLGVGGTECEVQNYIRMIVWTFRQRRLYSSETFVFVFVDLLETFLMVCVNVTIKPDGTNPNRLTQKGILIRVNNFLHSLFRQVDVS